MSNQYRVAMDEYICKSLAIFLGFLNNLKDFMQKVNYTKFLSHLKFVLRVLAPTFQLISKRDPVEHLELEKLNACLTPDAATILLRNQALHGATTDTLLPSQRMNGVMLINSQSTNSFNVTLASTNKPPHLLISSTTETALLISITWFLRIFVSKLDAVT